VKLAQDERSREQRRRFSLRFTCEHCALFDERAERCGHGFPTDEHREAHYASHDALVVFCKDFDLC
jgi:hypothetical protein